MKPNLEKLLIGSAIYLSTLAIPINSYATHNQVCNLASESLSSNLSSMKKLPFTQVTENALIREYYMTVDDWMIALDYRPVDQSSRAADMPKYIHLGHNYYNGLSIKVFHDKQEDGLNGNEQLLVNRCTPVRDVHRPGMKWKTKESN